MIDRNFVMALAAAMLLLVLYNVYYEWRFGDYVREQMDKQAAQTQSAEQAAEPGKEPAPTTTAGTPEEQGMSLQGTQEAPAAPLGEPGDTAATIPAAEEKLIRVKTGVTEVVLSTRGGALKSYLLENYKNADGTRVDLRFDLEKRMKALAEDGEYLKIKQYPPMGLKFPREGFSDKVNNAGFTPSVSEGEIVLSEGGGDREIAFEYQDSSGVHIKKVYTFHPGSYEFDFSVLVKSTEKWGDFDYSLVWFGLGDEVSDQSVTGLSYVGPVIMANGARIAEAPEEDSPKMTRKGKIDWAALTNRYYTASGIPEMKEDRALTARFIDDGIFSLEWGMRAGLSDEPQNFRFYVGPKEHKILEKYTNGMYSIIDYGWFDIIAKPLFWVMRAFHKYFGNWGWSIIALTVIVKVLFFPLTQKGFKSMQKLQKLQPHLKKLQDVYKDDKERLNRELMNLYREHKVNPLGGCLPMLLQIPIFFALYKTLLESIELKGAGWILWIEDLSMHDPYYITPVLMGISMLVQQMMTPKTGDPTQRKIMMALPFVFTFMFLNFPSGLVIYWLVNNILTIGQQWIIRREAS